MDEEHTCETTRILIIDLFTYFFVFVFLLLLLSFFILFNR